MNERQLKKKQAVRLKSMTLGMIIGVVSLMLSGVMSFGEVVSNIKVAFESGELLPINGSVWVSYDLGEERSGFEGQLKIDKFVDQGTGEGSPSDKSILTVVYDIKLPKDQHKGHVAYNINQSNMPGPNLLYRYTLMDAKGNTLHTGGIKHMIGEISSSSLVIGKPLSNASGILTDKSKELVVVKDNLKGEDSSFLQGFDNLILTHEEALSLSEADQKLILDRVASGGRLILINPQGHDKQNFIERQMGIQFKTSGVRNIKTDLALFIGANDIKDRWVLSGISESGETFVTTGYGKGQMLAFGYDPFALKDLSPTESQLLSRGMIYQNNSQLKINNYNFSLQYLAKRLPAEAIPAFSIMMLVFCLAVAIGIISGVYLVKVKRMSHGMLIGVSGATLLCLVMIPIYGMVVGYKGSLLNEVGYKHMDVDGAYEGITYIGVKSNKAKAILVSDRSLQLRTAESAYSSEGNSEVTQKVSEKLDTWEIKRKNKWAMDTFVVNDYTPLPDKETQVIDLKIKDGILSGTIRNAGDLPWQSPMLMVSGKYLVLPALKVGESYSLNQKLEELPNLGDSNNYVDFGRIYGTLRNAANENVDKSVFTSTLEYVNNNKGGALENRLVYFTKPKATGVRLEKERYGTNTVAINIYEIGKVSNPSKMAKETESLGNMRMLSGHATLVRYAANAEIQILPYLQENEFVVIWKPEQTKEAAKWQVKYQSVNMKNCLFYSPKTGTWETVKAGTSFDQQAMISRFADSEGQIYIRVIGTQNYLAGEALTLTKEGGQ